MRKFASLRTQLDSEGGDVAQDAVATDGTAWRRFWYGEDGEWGDWSQVRELPQPTMPDYGERDGGGAP